jgi:hypothetical protein
MCQDLISRGDVVAPEESGVVAAITHATFRVFALGNCVIGFVLEPLVVTVTAAAFTTQEVRLHLLAFFWSVAFSDKEDEIACFGTNPITSGKIRDNLIDRELLVAKFFPDLVHLFSVTDITEPVNQSQ